MIANKGWTELGKRGNHEQGQCGDSAYSSKQLGVASAILLGGHNGRLVFVTPRARGALGNGQQLSRDKRLVVWPVPGSTYSEAGAALREESGGNGRGH